MLGLFKKLCYDKNMLKKKFLTLGIALILGFSFIPVGATHAACNYLLGMPSWDCNVETENISTQDELTINIWKIVANIATDISVIATYLAIGYVIYGGYKYMFSGGDVGKVAAGKKTLNQAFIGLAITMSASIILNTIRVVITTNNQFSCDPSTGAGCMQIGEVTTMVTDIIQWFIGIGGTVALAFVIGGGIMYITSNADPGQLQKAKNMIKYALIGLAVVALSEAIIAFMTNVIK